MSPPKANRIGCPEFRRNLRRMDRRAFLKVGMLGAAGLTLSDLLRVEAQAKALGQSPDQLKSVIILWMRGGPSQHETWDPKPDAPSDYRGAFSSTPTKVPGIHICDHLPKSAAIMDKWSIIRSLHHDDAGHSSGDQLLFTGYHNEGNPDQNTKPSVGSIIAKQLQHQNPELPAYVMVPRMVPGTDSAYLGPAYKPFETGADPASTPVGQFKVQNFQPPDGITVDRIGSRRGLLRSLDRLRRDADGSGMMDAMDQFSRQAWDMVTGPAAQEAFDLDAEPMSVRNRYGFMPEFKAPTPNRCGVPAWSQRFVLARRLVEHGVRLVTVDCRWWDTHVEGFETMQYGFLPRWDQAFTALIEDLQERGMMDTTMVLCWGEFGRTPRVNANNGRDHYPNVFSAAMAGGGIQGGRVVGSSDSKGAFPLDNPKTPQDVLATVYRHLGVDVTAQYADASGRPISVLPSGEPIKELF
jgi:Protein of unknown function (DUF1501)